MEIILFDETLIKIQSNKKAFGVYSEGSLGIDCFLLLLNYTPYESKCVSNAGAFP